MTAFFSPRVFFFLSFPQLCDIFPPPLCRRLFLGVPGDQLELGLALLNEFFQRAFGAGALCPSAIRNFLAFCLNASLFSAGSPFSLAKHS